MPQTPTTADHYQNIGNTLGDLIAELITGNSRAKGYSDARAAAIEHQLKQGQATKAHYDGLLSELAYNSRRSFTADNPHDVAHVHMGGSVADIEKMISQRLANAYMRNAYDELNAGNTTRTSAIMQLLGRGPLKLVEPIGQTGHGYAPATGEGVMLNAALANQHERQHNADIIRILATADAQRANAAQSHAAAQNALANAEYTRNQNEHLINTGTKASADPFSPYYTTTVDNMGVERIIPDVDENERFNIFLAKNNIKPSRDAMLQFEQQLKSPSPEQLLVETAIKLPQTPKPAQHPAKIQIPLRVPQ